MSPSRAEAGFGADGRVLVVAEIGSNHDGRLDRAFALIDAAAAAGADAVQFHSFRGRSPQAPRDGAHPRPERLELLPEWHAPLRDRATGAGLRFLSTPFDEGRAALLAALGVCALPVAASDVTHLALLRAVGGFGRPILLGVALADPGEIDAALAAIDAGAGTPERRPALVLMAGPCGDAGGAGPLRALDTLAAHYPCAVGWADRDPETTLALGAVARGAVVATKPFTDDRSRPGAEHATALDPPALRAFAAAVRDLERALAASPPRRAGLRRGRARRVDDVA